MDVDVETFIEQLVADLDKQIKEKPDNMELLYNVARMLRVFNEMFTMNWLDVEIAEARIMDRKRGLIT